MRATTAKNHSNGDDKKLHEDIGKDYWPGIDQSPEGSTGRCYRCVAGLLGEYDQCPSSIFAGGGGARSEWCQNELTDSPRVV